MGQKTFYILAMVVVVPLMTSGWTGVQNGVSLKTGDRLQTGISVRARTGSGAQQTVSGAAECSFQKVDPNPPLYYAIDLVTTRKIRGARRATGTGNITYARSPFSVSISATGSYVYDLSIQLDKIDDSIDGRLVAWVTTTDLKDIRLVGILDGNLATRGRVDFNKFLVVITLEPKEKDVGEMWTGPVVLRGMSRSGLMHTKAGHGPFQIENCASYGYS